MTNGQVLKIKTIKVYFTVLKSIGILIGVIVKPIIFGFKMVDISKKEYKNDIE
jgi:uncharacterized protein YebE (UPF0316 family)